MKQLIFAWVVNGRIQHAGKIIGYNGAMRLLSGAGLKGYQRVAKWVPVQQLELLSKVALILPRTVDSLTLKEQRKRKSGK
jgi:hypothetical protein